MVSFDGSQQAGRPPPPPPLESGTVSILVLRALCLAVTRVGGDAGALLEDLGVSRTTLEQADARLPTKLVFRAFERAVVLTGDEALSLRAAETTPVGALEVVDFAMKSSATMGEALARATGFYALIDDACRLTLSVSSDRRTARLAGERASAPPPRSATELLFGLLVTRGRKLSGRSWPLRQVSFVRPPPRDTTLHERFFGAPVLFDQPRNEIVFDASWLEVRCLEHDAALAGFIDTLAKNRLSDLPQPSTLLEQVRRAIMESMRGSEPKLESTAKCLGLGARTLQRRLDELGTSHKRLIEEVRRALALELIADPNIAIAEVAHRLGFFDASTFHRAFKRWTALTPADYRRSSARAA